MQTRKATHPDRIKGMTLVELLVSASILIFVVAGAISSIVLFTQIATDHENRSDFARDLRNGMEVMSFDVRNATGISNRSDTSFTLSFSEGSNVTYSYDNTDTIYRTSSGQSRAVFRNVSEFDLLTSEADEPSNGALSYDRDVVSIERLTMSAQRGSSGSSEFSVTNFNINTRN